MRTLAALLLALMVAGCTREPGSTTLTKGELVIACDESLVPMMRIAVAEFLDQYKDAKITLRPLEAREAIADFVSDSVRMIVCARALNNEERDAIAASRIPLQEYHVAQSAVAVIANTANPLSELRLGQVDSMFRGELTRWPGKGKGSPIDVVIGDVNSSTNEVFRNAVLGGRKFALSATPMRFSEDLVEYVAKTPNAVGIVGLSWLKNLENRLNVISLGSPSWRPDSTRTAGQYYSPAQAYVFQGYYPVNTPVYIYRREVSRDLGLGFISYLTSAAGQKGVVKAGLVPVTMPVRLVQLTSDQVK
jgi:phosphate transport system substrate-binding protein